jgi:hypothetical protein
MKIYLSLMFCFLIGCSGSGAKQQSNSAATSNNPAGSNAQAGAPLSNLDDYERKYVTTSGAFLKNLLREDHKLQTTLAGIATGASTPEMVREAITRAKESENNGFFGAYKSAPVPRTFEAIDNRIQRAHDLHNEAFNDFYIYLKDNNPAHIESGSAKLKTAVTATNGAIIEVTRAMFGVK